MFKKARKFLKDITSKTDDIQVSSASQPHVLAVRMRQAGLAHNDEALVDIKNVRVIKGKLEEDQPSNTTTLFFCPVQDIVIKKRIKPGDGQYIDDRLKVTLEGIRAPKPVLRKQDGVYNLEGVILCANGSITVKATSKTKWVKV